MLPDMPMHDWTTVEAGTYHMFHQYWAVNTTTLLNQSLLPKEYRAVLERSVEGPIPDIIALSDTDRPPSRGGPGGLATMIRPKKTIMMTAARDIDDYAGKANHIVVRTLRKKVVAVIEFVSPGNKQGVKAIRQFLDKTIDFLTDRVNVMIVDPFPPGPRDPQGLHPLLRENFDNAPFKLPKKKPLTIASYQTLPELRAYVEPISVRSRLPEMPLFLKGDFYVNVPLEDTYQQTCEMIPADLRAAY